MIRILHRTTKGILSETHHAEDLPNLLAEKGGVTWVNLYEPDDAPDTEHAAMTALLQDTFSFHPLSVEDAMTDSQVPKVDDWGTYLYIVLHAVRFDLDLQDVDTSELDVFLGTNFLVTHHTEPIAAIDRNWKAALRDERHTKRGADYIFYELCDAIAADYMPCMDAMDDSIDRIEDQVFDKPTARTANKIFKLKSAVLNLRRVLSPQREVFNKLARDDYAVIDAKDRVYFRDVYDHFVRLADLNESLRDLTAGTLDTYLSVTANRTNDVMKTLTIVNVLFMPLTFLTGFFGMNFFAGIIEINQTAPINKWLFFGFVMILMLAIPFVIYRFVRQKGWW